MKTLELFANDDCTSSTDLATLYRNIEVTANSPKVIDLFCGCGGLSLGFKRAGYQLVAGIDCDEVALETFRQNLKAPGLNIDLSSKRWPELLEEQLGRQECQVLVGGPPCQGYSLTGTRDAFDPRNKLYDAMFVGLDYFEPDVVLIENVRGMATLFNGKAKAQVMDQFRQRGYEVVAKVLDSAMFGVPQHRLRLFFLATKKGTPALPEPVLTSSDYICCEEALSDLPGLDIEIGEVESSEYKTDPNSVFQTLMRGSSKTLTNHEATRHKQFVIDTIKQVPEGGNYKDLPSGVGESRSFNEAWTRYHSQKPSRTIDTGHRNHFHYKENRVPTVRENARLQSFPDNFKVYGTRTAQNRQVGNAVPVLLAQSIALQISNLLHD